MKKKLAVIIPPSLPIPPMRGGSIQTVVYDVLKRVSDFEIFTFSKRVADLPEKSVDKYGINHFYLTDKWYDNFEIVINKQFLVRHNRYIYKIAKMLKALDPDIVHIHNRPHFVPIVRKIIGNKAKIILTEHNQKISEDNYNIARIKTIMHALDKVINCSKKILELDLTARFPQYKNKTAVIYNSVDVEVFKAREAYDIAALKKKYGVVGKKVLLYVGRLVEDKSLAEIIEATKLVLNEEKEVVLLIVGSSFFSGAPKTKYIKKLEALAEPIMQSVKFTGFIDPQFIPEIYALADIFVSPVNWEDPSPKTIYEAAACETAIVSTKRGGIPEIVVDGESAILLDSPYEIEELAETIISLLREPETRARLGKNGRARMLQNFTTEIIAKKWADAYNNLI